MTSILDIKDLRWPVKFYRKFGLASCKIYTERNILLVLQWCVYFVGWIESIKNFSMDQKLENIVLMRGHFSDSTVFFRENEKTSGKKVDIFEKMLYFTISTVLYNYSNL